MPGLKAKFMQGVLAGVILSGLCLGFLYLLENPVQSGVQTLPVNIVYQDHQSNYMGEKARVSADQMFEGTIIHVRFYNLSLNTTYYIDMSQVGRIKEFNDTQEITIIMRVEEKNFCILGSHFRDLIWIWIGEIDV